MHADFELRLDYVLGLTTILQTIILEKAESDSLNRACGLVFNEIREGHNELMVQVGHLNTLEQQDSNTATMNGDDLNQYNQKLLEQRIRVKNITHLMQIMHSLEQHDSMEEDYIEMTSIPWITALFEIVQGMLLKMDINRVILWIWGLILTVVEGYVQKNTNDQQKEDAMLFAGLRILLTAYDAVIMLSCNLLPEPITQTNPNITRENWFSPETTKPSSPM